jgi:hypothetical protein
VDARDTGILAAMTRIVVLLSLLTAACGSDEPGTDPSDAGPSEQSNPVYEDPEFQQALDAYEAAAGADACTLAPDGSSPPDVAGEWSLADCTIVHSDQPSLVGGHCQALITLTPSADGWTLTDYEGETMPAWVTGTSTAAVLWFDTDGFALAWRMEPGTPLWSGCALGVQHGSDPLHWTSSERTYQRE